MKMKINVWTSDWDDIRWNKTLEIRGISFTQKEMWRKKETKLQTTLLSLLSKFLVQSVTYEMHLELWSFVVLSTTSISIFEIASHGSREMWRAKKREENHILVFPIMISQHNCTLIIASLVLWNPVNSNAT